MLAIGLCSQAPATTDLFSVFVDLPVVFHMNVIIGHVTSFVWLLSLGIRIPRFTHVIV